MTVTQIDDRPFTTLTEQIKQLQTRGMHISDIDNVISILGRENYYNVINGYKDLFLKKDANGNKSIPEEYIENVSFDEVYSLFLFDRDLRNIFMHYLLILENNIKARIAYRFSEKYRDGESYLDVNCYNDDDNLKEDVEKLVVELEKVIVSKSDSEVSNAIKHHRDNYKKVPLWVLVNFITLGNINYMYKSLDTELRECIAKDLSISYKKEYSQKHQITSEIVDSVLKMAVLFRNVCAHEDRLYNFKVHRKPRFSTAAKVLNIPIRLLDGSCFSMFSCLKLMLTYDQHQEMKCRIEDLFDKYSNYFSSIDFSMILNTMSFKGSWQDYF